MTTRIELGCDNGMQAQARASHRGQSPGFQRFRIGELLITAVYDGFLPVAADDLHDAPPAEIHRFPSPPDSRSGKVSALEQDSRWRPNTT